MKRSLFIMVVLVALTFLSAFVVPGNAGAPSGSSSPFYWTVQQITKVASDVDAQGATDQAIQWKIITAGSFAYAFYPCDLVNGTVDLCYVLSTHGYAGPWTEFQLPFRPQDYPKGRQEALTDYYNGTYIFFSYTFANQAGVGNPWIFFNYATIGAGGVLSYVLATWEQITLVGHFLDNNSMIIAGGLVYIVYDCIGTSGPACAGGTTSGAEMDYTYSTNAALSTWAAAQSLHVSTNCDNVWQATLLNSNNGSIYALYAQFFTTTICFDFATGQSIPNYWGRFLTGGHVGSEENIVLPQISINGVLRSERGGPSTVWTETLSGGALPTFTAMLEGYVNTTVANGHWENNTYFVTRDPVNGWSSPVSVGGGFGSGAHNGELVPVVWDSAVNSYLSLGLCSPLYTSVISMVGTPPAGIPPLGFSNYVSECTTNYLTNLAASVIIGQEALYSGNSVLWGSSNGTVAGHYQLWLGYATVNAPLSEPGGNTQMFIDSFQYANPELMPQWTIDQYQFGQTGIYTQGGYMRMVAQSSSTTESVHVNAPLAYSTGYGYPNGTIIKRKLTAALVPFTLTVSVVTADVRIGMIPLYTTGAFPGVSPAGNPISDYNCALGSIEYGDTYMTINNVGVVTYTNCGDGGSTVMNLETVPDPTLYSVMTVETSAIFCSVCTDNQYPGTAWAYYRFYQHPVNNPTQLVNDKSVNITSNVTPLANNLYISAIQTVNDGAAGQQVTKLNVVQLQNYGSPVCLGCIPTLPTPPPQITGSSRVIDIMAYLASFLGGGDEQVGAFLLYFGFLAIFVIPTIRFTHDTFSVGFEGALITGIFIYGGFIPLLFLILIVFFIAFMGYGIYQRLMGSDTFSTVGAVEAEQ